MSVILAIDIFGVIVAAALFVTLWWRPNAAFGVVFVLVLVGIAIVVNWQQIAQYRQQHAATMVLNQPQPPGTNLAVAPYVRLRGSS
jgi:hypothetical protein